MFAAKNAIRCLPNLLGSGLISQRKKRSAESPRIRSRPHRRPHTRSSTSLSLDAFARLKRKYILQFKKKYQTNRTTANKRAPITLTPAGCVALKADDFSVTLDQRRPNISRMAKKERQVRTGNYWTQKNQSLSAVP